MILLLLAQWLVVDCTVCCPHCHCLPSCNCQCNCRHRLRLGSYRRRHTGQGGHRRTILSTVAPCPPPGGPPAGRRGSAPPHLCLLHHPCRRCGQFYPSCRSRRWRRCRVLLQSHRWATPGPTTSTPTTVRHTLRPRAPHRGSGCNDPHAMGRSFVTIAVTTINCCCQQQQQQRHHRHRYQLPLPSTILPLALSAPSYRHLC